MSEKPENSSSLNGSTLILVVDDEESIRLTIRFALENVGYNVIEAANGNEAVEVFLDKRPDLTLLDVMMDDMDGFETCDAIRNSPGGEHLPIIMMTSLEDEVTIQKSFDSGATDFVVKPINLLILGFRIQYWLRSSTAFLNLQLNEQRLNKAQQIAKLGNWEWSAKEDDIEVNCHSPENFGLTHRTNYRSFIENISEKDREMVSRVIDRSWEEKQPFSLQYRIKDNDGAEHIILNQGKFIFRNHINKTVAVGIVQDITEMKEAESQIHFLAYYDSLTGLANRSLFREYWKKTKALADRSQKLIAVMFIDLDHFKQINDTLGHPMGDQILIQVAERLKTTLRNSDIISRYAPISPDSLISRVGGDEFTLIATSLNSPDNASNLAERLLEKLSAEYEVGGHQLNVTASLGISMYPEDGKDLDTLLKHADTAMYEAKSKGRNTFQFFHEELNEAVRARFNLQNRLQRALSSDEMELYFQPRYNRTGKTIKGVEALIRWNDPEKGLIMPKDFLPFAEENSFIHLINDWVINEACAQTRTWLDQGLFHGCVMSFNISGRGLNFKKLQETIVSCLEKYTLEPSCLEVELTERVMIEKSEEARIVLGNLRDLGISIAIDDFGTGYSALSHLQSFPLTTLKIDKSFINNIDQTENGLELLLSIINIAKCHNLRVVAEGVETTIQRNALEKMACDELQGFLLSTPVPSKKIVDLLKS